MRKVEKINAALRREIAARPRGLDAVLGRPEPHGNLRDGLRNVSRTATRRLDEAGVPDRLQGADEADWDCDELEGRFDDF